MASWTDFISGGAGTAGGAVSALLSAGGTQEAIKNIRELRGDITGLASEYTTRGREAAEFQPFTVTTGAGTAAIGPSGALTTQAAQQPLIEALQARAGTTAGALGADTGLFGGISQQALQQAQAALAQPTPTAESLFAQLQATTAGEQERQRIALENRLAAQGRLGVQTAAYGGTPEQLALEKAIQEQQSRNLVTATQLAPQLAQQQTAQAAGLFGLGAQAAGQPTALEAAQIQNIGGLLSTAFAPEQQLIQSITPSLQAAQLAQAGRASEAELLGALGPGVLQAVLGTGETEATLQQQQINALLQALGIDYAPTPSDTIFNITPTTNVDPGDVTVNV
jgi:hypothetical protein